MAQKNPHFRLHWFEAYPRLVREDAVDLVKSIMALYPEAIIFNEHLHFSWEGIPPRPIEFFQEPDAFWQIDPNTGRRRGILALRVPTVEDIASDDLERLIGGRDRKPFGETIEQSRRFGRCLYVHGVGGMFEKPLKVMTAEYLAQETDYLKDEYRDLKALKEASGCRIHCPHDADSPEHMAFVKAIRSAISPLTTRAYGIYDARTGEPIGITQGQPASRRFMKRCSLEPDLCWSEWAIIDGVSTILGPTPKLRAKWRAEAGLAYDFKTSPESVRVIPFREEIALRRAGRWKAPIRARIR